MFSRPTEPIRLTDGRVVVADHGTAEIRFFDSSGRWLTSVGRRGQGPGEFTDLRTLVVGRARGAASVTEERLAEIEKELREAPYRDDLPAYDALAIAANGDLWLREYVVAPDAPTRFVVVDSSGRWRAFATGPARFTPSWIGPDQVIGSWTDPDDVVHVRAYALTRT